MPGIFERFFDRGPEAPQRSHRTEGKRVSRAHPREFNDILAAEVAELRRGDKPLHHLKKIQRAERVLLPTFEGRIDKTTLNTTGNPLARKVLTGLHDFFSGPQEKTATIRVPRSKKGLPEYSPALLARLDYRGSGKHDALGVHMGALMLEREKLRKKLLQLTQKTNRLLERTANDKEKEAIRDHHRRARLDLIRQLREAQGLMLSKTKELDAFLVRREKQGERPSLLKDAFEHARDFLRGTSPRKTSKRKTVPAQDHTLTLLGKTLQSTWSKLAGTQSSQPSREELYAIIENGLQDIASIEQRVAERIGKATPQPGAAATEISSNEGALLGGKPQEPATQAADAETKAAVFPPIAHRILLREQLTGISPEGLRYYLANRLQQIAGIAGTSTGEGGLMTKDEYEKTITQILEDPGTIEARIEEFSSFIDQEILEINLKQSTTFKGGGGILGVFTRTVQMVKSERYIRNVTDQISGDFLWHAGVTSKKEKVERAQIRELLESYISQPKRTDQEIAALFGKLKSTEVLWVSDAFGDIKGRLAPIARDMQDIINDELNRRKEMPAARGALLFRLGCSAKEDQHIPQEQFNEAMTLWLNEPNRTAAELQHAREVINQLATQETKNQHIAELYTDVSQRISDRIRSSTLNKDEIIHAEFGKLLKDLGIQAAATSASPEAAQLHVNQWLSGVPQWSDDALRTTFASVNALIAREGMEEIHTQKESPFLPFLREVNAYLKKERRERAERNARALASVERRPGQESLPAQGQARDESGEQPIIEKPLDLTVQPNSIRGSILERFAIPGADVAVGKKYFENRIKEWFAQPTTTSDQKDRFTAFCKEQLVQLEILPISKKRQKREIFEHVGKSQGESHSNE